MPLCPANKLDVGNAQTYSRAAIRRLYTDEKWLPSEASLLLDYSTDIISKRVLELGAGSGRLASVLHHRSAEYVATDVNPIMVATLLKVHPTVMAVVADARSLDCFPPERFDTVLFSFNGLDSIPFEDRRRVLSEASRVLAPGGAFIHSTHNSRYAQSASYRPPLSTLAGRPIDFFRRCWNRHRLKKFEQFLAEYAVVNDRSLHNGLLNVYVRPSIHMKALADAGFIVDSTYDRGGRRYIDCSVPDDQWYYVVARKPNYL